MKYVKLFEELDYSTNWGKRQAQKAAQKTKTSNSNFKQKFLEKYPKGTKLVFEDKESEYELILDDIKFDESNVEFYLDVLVDDEIDAQLIAGREQVIRDEVKATYAPTVTDKIKEDC